MSKKVSILSQTPGQKVMISPLPGVTSGILTGLLQTLHGTIVGQLAQLGVTAS